MNKTLTGLALAATTAALMLSACNGNSGTGSGTSPLPNARASNSARIRPNDTGPQDLHAGGATFPAYGYNLGDQPVGVCCSGPPQATPGPGSVLHNPGTTGKVYYCLTGSGFGRKEFESNQGTATTACAALGQSPTGFGARVDPLDFAGSDQAMPSSECCASGTAYYNGRLTGTQTWGQPFELPTFGGPLVFPYNKNPFTGISSSKFMQLSTWTYCAIANGTISNWNDAAITKDNGGVSVTGGSNETLDFYFRSDNSGTTYLTTNKFTHTCNVTWKAPYNKDPYQNLGKGRDASWTFGVNQAWPGPGSSGDPNPRFTGESGNPGVIAGIQADQWGTGYAEGAWAAAAPAGTYGALEQAALLDTGNKHFISPTNKAAVAEALENATHISFGEGSDGNPLGSTTPWCQLFISPTSFVKPPAGSYPFVGLSYWLFYGQNNGVHVPDKKKLIKFITSSTANKLLAKIEYTPLANSVHSQVITALNGSGSHTACLQ